MAFADLSARLNLNISDFSTKLATASKQMGDFAKNLNKGYGTANAALSKHSLGLKDVARIVQGIMVSQAFYRIAQSISSATRSLVEFNEQLDYAQVTYSALFGSADLASDFTKVLQEHSVNTIFNYSDLANASKKMLAYGIEYENLMYIMEGLTNLGAMSGDTAAMDRIALALGQIQTTGYLAATEMRQLANAYVPIYEIVQKSFNLTGEQMKNVGELRIPAEQVINAIVDYANAKFGGVGDAAMLTITGLKNRVVDTMKVMGSEMTRPITTAWKSFLKYVGDGLTDVRSVYSAGGLGGLFEYFVPDKDKQTTIRAFFANLHNMILSIVSSLRSVISVVGVFGQAFMVAFNLVAPTIIGVVNVLAASLQAITQNAKAAAVLRTMLVLAAGAFVALKIHAVGALVITAVTKAVNGLSKALLLLGTLISRHPILMLIAGLSVALVGIAAAGNNADNSLSKLFKTLSGAGGTVGQEDIFKKVEGSADDATNAIDQFNKRLGVGSDAADALEDGVDGAGKAADKAAKKVSGLLSFDEVFKLPDPAKDAASGGGFSPYTGLTEDLAALTEGLGAFGDALIPEIPDFGEFVDSFVDDLYGGLTEGIIDRLGDASIGALIGAAIGAVFGGLLGGPGGALLGAKIGAMAGAVVGWFWNSIKDAFGFTDTTTITSMVPAAIGAALGFSAFGVPGALLAGAIGLFSGNLVGMLWEKLADALGKSPETAQFTSSAGMAIGAVIGMLLGGPPGALIGAGIGTLAGGIVGMFWSEIKEGLMKPDTAIGAAIGGSIGAFFGPVGAAIGAVVGGIIGNFWQDIADGFSAWWAGISQGFLDWWAGITAGWSAWCEATTLYLTTWLSELVSSFFAKQSEINENSGMLLNVFHALWTSKLVIIKTLVGTFWLGLKTLFSLGQAVLTGDLDTWWETTKESWREAFAGILDDMSIWWENVLFDQDTHLGRLFTSIASWLSNVTSKWLSGFNTLKEGLATWWAGYETSQDSWLEYFVWKPIANFFKLENFWNRIKGLLDAIKAKVESWWKSITSIFSSSITVSTAVETGKDTLSKISGMGGHATGGIFDREHVARFAEGNKAEAVIPLENASAMQPFVNAISDGILQGLMPVMATTSNQNNMPPMYVGTLIADDRGIRQLYKKFEIIEAQEAARKGFA